MSFIFFNLSAIIIFNHNNFPSLLQQHIFSDDVLTEAKVGHPVTHMRSQQLQTTTIQ